MLLAVDAGNTDTVFGLSDQPQRPSPHSIPDHASLRWLQVWRTRSQTDRPVAHYESQLRLWLLESGLSLDSIQAVVLSSVVPALTPTLQTMLTNLFGHSVIVVGPTIYPMLPLEVLRPYEIGSDLVANALAAYSSYQQNCVVVDFGTALTFTTVSGTGRILGIAIAPGLKTAVKSLFANTAQLPEVPLVLPDSALGTSTTHAIQAGVVLGYEGLVRSLIQRTRAELNGDCLAIATGGLVSAIPTLHPEFAAVRPNLTLDGIREIGLRVSGAVPPNPA